MIFLMIFFDQMYLQASQLVPSFDCTYPTSHSHVILYMDPEQLTAPFPQYITGSKLSASQVSKK